MALTGGFLHGIPADRPGCGKNRCGGAFICLYYSEMRLHSSRHSFLICGMILFLSLNSALRGLVFCFGSDGHRAIESEHEGACRQARHLPADPANSRPHQSIASERGLNFFCRDVHFHLDRLVTDNESRQKKRQSTVFGNPLSFHGMADVPDFGLDDSRPYVTDHDLIPLLGKNSILRC